MKSCAFCGEDETVMPCHADGWHFIECMTCFTQGPRANTAEAALEGWETRVSEHILREVIQLMCHALESSNHTTLRNAAIIRAREALAMR